jgi:hypothetical protein
MKKILAISFVMLLISAVTNAQSGTRRYRTRESGFGTSISGPEKSQLRRDVFRYRTARRSAGRDGRIGPLERRKLHKMRCRTRRDAVRFRHNGRNRLI